MKKFEVTDERIQAAFSAAKSEETKQILAALFGQQKEKVKPTLDDYTTIKTYEDACEALGLAPIYSDLSKDADRAICEYSEAQRQYCHIMKLPNHILALMKLETVSRALWGRNWEPKPDANGTTWFYYPRFALWTVYELDGGLTEEQLNAFIPIDANDDVSAGFGYLTTYYRISHEVSGFEYRLYQETEEKAKYFGQQFIKLWAEYFKFNFEVE